VSLSAAAAAAAAAAAPFPQTLALSHCVQPKVKVLTQDDVASGRYSIFDVVMPVPGFGTQFPLHSCGKQLVSRLVTEDGMDADEVWMQRRHRDQALVGTYRHLLKRAQNVSWDVVSYADPLVRGFHSERVVWGWVRD
jgi:tRNA pseudouridine13 synthase